MADANDFLNPGLLPPSPDLVPIPSTEYPNYFFRYQNRYFPLYRHPLNVRNDPQVQLPSVLPIDRYEMERRTVLHNLVNLCLGHKNWFGPFEQYVSPPEGKLVVDVGSDNGRWIEEVSDEFPHAIHFRGIEIFPSSPTEAANNNVRFEVYDFQRERIRHGDASVDVIHARFQNFHIQDWDTFLSDVARCLKPGGLFMRQWGA
ncbi:methyltransferase domain protein [Rhizoctonia solani AG-3 Rhs1AP]|uniref:Methyltransferase domain protein n=1 Tax=Rhizoctonia solani AG-3 Rhs1AP TaxID=1086054 RepID=X8IY04_9AGAM|nr:methyltransferase domain protein [Rhizoctonia solani AG-3 Rhs1AP]